MNRTVRPYCRRCNKRLITFRVNKDWKTRPYHRKCWKLRQAELEHKMMLDFHKRMYEEDQMLMREFPE